MYTKIVYLIILCMAAGTSSISFATKVKAIDYACPTDMTQIQFNLDHQTKKWVATTPGGFVSEQDISFTGTGKPQLNKFGANVQGNPEVQIKGSAAHEYYIGYCWYNPRNFQVIYKGQAHSKAGFYLKITIPQGMGFNSCYAVQAHGIRCE